MRIISGIFKGKKLYSPKDKFTRPLKDLTKESLFNIILHSNKFNGTIIDAKVLDLFSGVGSFGLECLSRKARSVTFVENYKIVIPILRKNILSLNLSEKSKVIEKQTALYLTEEAKLAPSSLEVAYFCDLVKALQKQTDELLFKLDEKLKKQLNAN